MNELALFGGRPVREKPFPKYNTIGEEEKRAAMAVLDNGVLSQFLGTWSPDFYGGPRVQTLERSWEAYFRVSHAVSMNSATSGLYAAVGAAGVRPGDEVIVSPYTMAASATAALIYGGIPVFADIDPETFCLSPESIRKNINTRTKAIIVVDLFGRPADMNEIMEVAKEHDLVVIEDAAQAPGAKYHGRYAGTLADIGVFSLNYHKTIHCGEGGIVVTANPIFAERLQLIRNHAEAVVEAKGVTDLTNMIGYNYRMTEIEAAIAAEQLKKLERLVSARIAAASRIAAAINGIPGLNVNVPGTDIRHGYYVVPISYDAAKTGVPRSRFVEAVRAEGIPVGEGYVKPLYLHPLYQQQQFIFKNERRETARAYPRGLCPVAEKMHFDSLITCGLCHADLLERDLDDITEAFEKVASLLK